MIYLRDRIPEKYFDDSRDFQFIARAFEVLFNHVKTGTDLIKENQFSRNSDLGLLNLLATTLGFDINHDYNVDDLKAACSAFTYLIKNKGSEKAIRSAIQLLLTNQNIDDTFYLDYGPKVEAEEGYDPYDIKIIIPYDFQDVILLEDIFDYILPAGFTYTITRAVKGTTIYKTYIRDLSRTNTKLSYSWQTGQISRPETITIEENNNTVTIHENVTLPTVDDIPDALSMTFTGTVVGPEGNNGGNN